MDERSKGSWSIIVCGTVLLLFISVAPARLLAQEVVGDLTKPPLTTGHAPRYIRQVLEPSFQQSFAIAEALGLICAAVDCVPTDAPEPAPSLNTWLRRQLELICLSDVGGRISICFLKVAAEAYTAPDSRLDNPGGGATEVFTSDPSNAIAINARWLQSSGSVGGLHMKPGGGAGSFEASISVAGTIFHEFMHSQEVKTKTTPNSTPEEKCAHWENHASIHDRTSNFYEMVKASQQCLGVNGKEEHLQKLIDGAQANKAKFEALMVKNGC